VVLRRRLLPHLEPAEALTLGRALAGLTAHAKGERLEVQLMGRTIPVVRTPEGLRALDKDKPTQPGSVERYLAGKFGADLEPVRAAMQALAGSLPPAELARRAFALYKRFRPAVPEGEGGWGAKGMLDLDRIRSATEERSRS
jgi:hypothetical protein